MLPSVLFKVFSQPLSDGFRIYNHPEEETPEKDDKKKKKCIFRKNDDTSWII